MIWGSATEIPTYQRKGGTVNGVEVKGFTAAELLGKKMNEGSHERLYFIGTGHAGTKAVW